MNEYDHIPSPPPPPPAGWVPYRGAPGLVPPAPSVSPVAPYAATPVASRRHRHRGWVAVTSVVALGASIVGVAAIVRHGDSAERSPLAAAVAGTEAQKTARVDVTVNAPGLPSPLVTTAEVDLSAGVTHLTMDLSALAGLDESAAKFGAGPVEVLTKGSVAYVKMGGLADLLGGNAKWIKFDATAMAASGAGSAAGSFGGGTTDPAALLDLLKQQADSVTEVGHESVRGVDTTHYTAVIDVARIASEHASGATDPSAAAAVEKLAGTKATVDVWVDADNVVRKLTVHAPSTEGDATITLEFYDFGKPVNATIPADADTIDLTTLIGHR